jgi:hypothetical protein
MVDAPGAAFVPYDARPLERRQMDDALQTASPPE